MIRLIPLVGACERHRVSSTSAVGGFFINNGEACLRLPACPGPTNQGPAQCNSAQIRNRVPVRNRPRQRLMTCPKGIASFANAYARCGVFERRSKSVNRRLIAISLCAEQLSNRRLADRLAGHRAATSELLSARSDCVPQSDRSPVGASYDHIPDRRWISFLVLFVALVCAAVAGMVHRQFAADRRYLFRPHHDHGLRVILNESTARSGSVQKRNARARRPACSGRSWTPWIMTETAFRVCAPF